MFKSKHYYTMGLLMAGMFTSHAQVIMNNPVTEQNKSVTDPYSIRLLPGFNATSSAANNFRASIGASSNPNPVPPVVNVDPATSITVNENYIYTRNYLDPVTATSASAKQAQSVTYFDGLGRPKQEVVIKTSPTGKDLVTDIPYDGFGRQVQSWLPVPMNSQNGNIQSGVQTASSGYYKKSDGITIDPLAYGEKTLENSPLDRLLAQSAPGSEWEGKKVTYNYEANVDNEVIKFVTNTNWVTSNGISTMSSSLKISSENNTSVSGCYYKGSTLYKNVVTDEDGNTSIEFKNGQGQVILVRKTDGAVSLDTYYVYNEYDQLAFVIPPLAVEAVKSIIPGTVISAAILNSLCYQYQYDSQKRLVAKRLPGKGSLTTEDGWEYMIYDQQDRMVLTQDPKMKTTNQWFFTKYDKLGRVLYTGLSTITGDRASIQSAVDTKGINDETRATIPVTISGLPMYYTNSTAYPTSIAKLLSVNYYDTYPVGSPTPTNAFGQPMLQDIPEAITSNGLNSMRSTNSLPTASFVNNIENDAWTKNYTWYDTKGRVIGSRSDNHLGGYTIVNNRLDFAGAVLNTNTYHKRLATDPEKLIKEAFSYDHQNRLTKHTHQVDSNPIETLTENIYNELGQLEYQNTGNGMQSVKQEYNIRGTLAKVNDPKNLMNKLFGYELKYINPQNTTKKYNGNIAEMDWATQNDGALRRYSYKYDKTNRLTQGNYWANSELTAGSYAEKLTYDQNGNIKSLQRAGQTAASIDNLTYIYDNAGNSNRLIKVTDASGSSEGYPTGGNTIAYDMNGNMTNQLDKGISNIAYNYLNLPNSITATSGNTTNTYRADGVKMRKVFSGKTVDYLDGFQYENDVLQFIPTVNGYYDTTKNKYIYHYTDHLGNVRLSYTKGASGGAEIIEENNYYPFGLKHQGYNTISLANSAYQYKFNGKELQETGMYDYGARMYMPELGRWGVHDDLSELQLHYSPYSYVYNNPIFFNDPTGMIGESIGDDDSKKKNSAVQEIKEVVITKYKALSSKFTAQINLREVAKMLTPIRPLDSDEVASINAKYGPPGQGLGNDLSRMWKQIKDIPSDLADTVENIKNISESENKEEVIIATAILAVNLRKGKIGNVAKMGSFGGKFMKLAKTLKLNINSPTTMSILENADKTVQEFISTHRQGNIKSVFPAEHLNSTVKEALQSGNTTVRKLLTDSRFLK
ncbi:DUF6443 domain-containing protein [Elizabethkingia meningoseptica]|uniref:DUF6443 domain-containing protein n=1 Tax=Elizabethkingia meningoseptica TaxID=238 RepID=UPI00389201CC